MNYNVTCYVTYEQGMDESGRGNRFLIRINKNLLNIFEHVVAVLVTWVIHSNHNEACPYCGDPCYLIGKNKRSIQKYVFRKACCIGHWARRGGAQAKREI